MSARRTEQVLYRIEGGGRQADVLEVCTFHMGTPTDMPLHVRWHSAQRTWAVAARSTQQVLYIMKVGRATG